MWGTIFAFVFGAVGPWAIQALIGLGVSTVTYTGMKLAINSIQSNIYTQIGGLPADLVNMLGMMGVDTGINIIFSAIAARAALAGWSANSRRRNRLELWNAPGAGANTITKAL